MNWILILTMTMGGNAVAISTVPYWFPSRDACEVAGNAWSKAINDRQPLHIGVPVFSCVNRLGAE